MKETKKVKKILVIDAIPENIREIIAILGDEYNLISAPDIKTALNLIQSLQNIPDLLVIDTKMQDGDGFDVCSALKKDISKNRIPVLFMGWKGEIDDEMMECEVEPVGFINRPYDPGEVISAIKEVL